MAPKSTLQTPYTVEEWAGIIQVWSGGRGNRMSDEEALAQAKQEYADLKAAGEEMPCPEDLM